VNEDVPDSIRNAAILQMISGVVNFMFMAGLGSALVSTFCGTLTFFVGGCGAIFGMAACLLFPIGAVEAIIGLMAMTQPQKYAQYMRYGAYLELASLLCGGILSAAAGFMVLQMLGSDEAEAYLLTTQG